MTLTTAAGHNGRAASLEDVAKGADRIGLEAQTLEHPPVGVPGAVLRYLDQIVRNR
jgi:hypothetical protein